MMLLESFPTPYFFSPYAPELASFSIMTGRLYFSCNIHFKCTFFQPRLGANKVSPSLLTVPGTPTPIPIIPYGLGGAEAINRYIMVNILSLSSSKDKSVNFRRFSKQILPSRSVNIPRMKLTPRSITMEYPATLLNSNITGLLPPLDLPGPDSYINCSLSKSLTEDETVPLFKPVKPAVSALEMGK